MDKEKKKLVGKALKKVGELLDDTPSEQALLTEYQVCQSHNSSLTTEFWAVTTILLSINVALLGGLFYSVATSLFGINNPQKILITAIAVVMIFVSVYFAFWLKRLQFLEHIHFVRMREIENLLSLEKSWLVVGLDKPKNKRPDDFPDKLITKVDRLITSNFPKFHKYKILWPDRFFSRYESPFGGWLVFSIFMLVIPLWILFVLLIFSVLWYLALLIFIPFLLYIIILKIEKDKENKES